MEIYLTIKHIYPSITEEEFQVLDDNQWKWPYIIWNTTNYTQPTQAELDAAWVECEKKTRLQEIWKEMKAINEKIVQLWWASQFITDNVLDAVTSSKITSLVSEYNTLKAERDANYSSSVIEDVFNSIF